MKKIDKERVILECILSSLSTLTNFKSRKFDINKKLFEGLNIDSLDIFNFILKFETMINKKFKIKFSFSEINLNLTNKKITYKNLCQTLAKKI